MLIILNMTGLEKIYWAPKIEYQHSLSAKIWYATIRWFGIEFCIYNKKMGAEIVRRINSTIKYTKEDQTQPDFV